MGLKHLPKRFDLIPIAFHPSSCRQDAHMAESQSWILVRWPYLSALLSTVCVVLS